MWILGKEIPHVAYLTEQDYSQYTQKVLLNVRILSLLDIYVPCVHNPDKQAYG